MGSDRRLPGIIDTGALKAFHDVSLHAIYKHVETLTKIYIQ